MPEHMLGIDVGTGGTRAVIVRDDGRIVAMTSIRLGGGGARSRLWRQIQADVYGREVEIVEAEEGAAYGAAILAGVGGHLWPSVDAACSAVVRVAARVRPEAATTPTMETGYAAYRRIYPAITSIFRA